MELIPNAVVTGVSDQKMFDIEENTVDLVYMDPPFNTGRDFGVFSDKWGEEYTWLKDETVINFELAKFTHEKHSKAMLHYLDMISLSLWQAKAAMKSNGSIYFHCSNIVSHYVKVLMDSIFGHKNFRGEIIWKRHNAHNDVKRKYSIVSDSILFYALGDYTFNVQYIPHDEEYIRKVYTRTDERGRYRTSDINASSGLAGKGYRYVFHGVDKEWTYPEHRLKELEADGRIYFPERGRIPKKKTYLHEVKGKPMTNVWEDINTCSTKERVGYPTQKPLKLLERIISASSNPGDIVLDPFCGSGTTLVAAHKLGRRYIGIDINPDAVDLSVKRLKGLE